MVSLWPFGGDDNSAASFEKALSTLSGKIQRASAKNDTLRQHQRRYKALWTLYTVFAYILVTAILTLITGYDKWGSIEYTTITGGPVIIYGVRLALETYYTWRLSKREQYLAGLHQERDKVIARLKDATKYNSTQQLLEKYGGQPPQPQQEQRRQAQGPGKRNVGGQQSQGKSLQQPLGRTTGFAPPPTANIPNKQPISGPVTVSGPVAPVPPGQGNLPASNSSGPGEEFAPNAFSPPTGSRPNLHNRGSSVQYAPTNDGPKWYDRLMDVILGEDETQAKNRFALICRECRLVNGQAPPGARTLEDVGRWRCSACGCLNGAESEASKIM
ncbi:hypothetical protein K431DRAFT_203803, partial [Polychaeton citri CBS 116435]